MSWSKLVYSSMVNEIGYDDETQEMIVTWNNGKRSIYSGVPEALADQVSRSFSVGSAINSDIKGSFPHRYG